MIRPFEQHHPDIHPSAYIAPEATVIGQVSIAQDASVWPACVLRGDVQRIEIGKRTNIQDGAVLHVTHDGPRTPGGQPLIIGDDITVGHKAILHACVVEPFCLIGIGCIVLDGAIVEHDTLLGAGTLVPPGKRLESGYLWLGAPAKRIRPLTDDEQENIRYSSQHYATLAKRHQGS